MKTLLSWLAALMVALGGADSSIAQSATNEMWLRGNALATRQRMDREIRQARTDGVIKRWSPVAIDIPLNLRYRAASVEGDPGPPQIEREITEGIDAKLASVPAGSDAN
jgi:hypothetical protein